MRKPKVYFMRLRRLSIVNQFDKIPLYQSGIIENDGTHPHLSGGGARYYAGRDPQT
jgi:hypothetical protein